MAELLPNSQLPLTFQDNDDSDCFLTNAPNLAEIFALSNNWQVLQDATEFENHFLALLDLPSEDEPDLVVFSNELKVIVLIGLGPNILNKVRLKWVGLQLTFGGWSCYVKNIHQLKLSRYKGHYKRSSIEH